MITELLVSLGDTALASWLRQSGIGYPLLSTAHILGIALLLGSVLILDLRLLGITKSGALNVLAPLLNRFAACGLLLAMVTGSLLFSVQPAHYLANSAFLLKLTLLLLALLNVLLVHWLPHWQALLNGQAPTLFLKVTALLSLVLWLVILLAGRWIAFV
ncbi:DUF2214 domain-containing protein [Alkalimonas collagenimarina]|uniref:DUF2214 domain-containing protein n=1 Tax=Alkalimonas collagenimarina TaxID=400390 RepID=A0ABT9GWD8_9GAMM|nr:DUF6644 family protein [Alkalimonas collagenimarina]MDP4535370.1 DUF2214 domain-containing protein [Alkalimonas collagenimarina]